MERQSMYAHVRCRCMSVRVTSVLFINVAVNLLPSSVPIWQTSRRAELSARIGVLTLRARALAADSHHCTALFCCLWRNIERWGRARRGGDSVGGDVIVLSVTIVRSHLVVGFGRVRCWLICVRGKGERGEGSLFCSWCPIVKAEWRSTVAGV